MMWSWHHGISAKFAIAPGRLLSLEDDASCLPQCHSFGPWR